MGYYWVPGVWVAPPRIGVLWTPGYWAFGNGLYQWNAGYWGPHVGFYGGVNYGFGFGGVGFYGGGWSGGAYRYNTAVTNVNTTVIHNTYVDRTVINNTTINNNTRASFNGPGGVNTAPNNQERAYMHEQRLQATPNQLAHEHTASQDRSQLVATNHGRPAVASMDTVNGRRFNQQARIANGASTGQLRPGQTQRLEGQQGAINREVHADRQANGGALTPQHAQVNRQQDNASHATNADRRQEHQQQQNRPSHEDHRAAEQGHEQGHEGR
jgi:hypothetical protein